MLALVRLFTMRDAMILASKLMSLVTSGERRQWEHLEHTPLADYVRAERLSGEAAKFVQFPELGGIADADGISARAFARVLHLIVRGRKPGLPGWLSLMDGPESQTWIDPWARHLEGLGVRFHTGHAVTELACDGSRVTSALVRNPNGDESGVQADWYVLALPPDRAAGLMGPDLVAADPRLGRIAALRPVRGVMMQIFIKRCAPQLGTLFVSPSAPWDIGAEVLTSAWQLDLADYGDGRCPRLRLGPADRRELRPPARTAVRQAGKGLLRAGTDRRGLRAASTLPPRRCGDVRRQRDSSFHLNPIHDHTGGQLSVDEPMFSSSPSCWQHQPDAVTDVANLFLAGSYTRTVATVDSMEAADESGKRAANAVLAASGVRGAAADVPVFEPPRWLKLLWALDDRLFARGYPNLFDHVTPSISRRSDDQHHRPGRPQTRTGSPDRAHVA